MTLYYITWFILALILVIFEMHLMSFYLMALALGAAAGGIAAYFEFPLQEQCMIAAIATIVAACGAFYLRRKFKSHLDKSHNDLDHGQRVVVKEDNIREDGTALVSYRGSEWIAYKPNAVLKAGIYFIERINGTQLVLGDQLPQNEPQAKDSVSSTENSAQDASTIAKPRGQKHSGDTAGLEDKEQNDSSYKF